MTQGDFGQELKQNNEKIIECIVLLREQRDELAFIIERQYEERKKLETEMERITYKLCLINKSLAQRIKAKSMYDSTLNEVEAKYGNLVKNSGDLLQFVQKEYAKLDSMMNKKTNTDGEFQEKQSSVKICSKKEPENEPKQMIFDEEFKPGEVEREYSIMAAMRTSSETSSINIQKEIKNKEDIGNEDKDEKSKIIVTEPRRKSILQHTINEGVTIRKFSVVDHHVILKEPEDM